MVTFNDQKDYTNNCRFTRDLMETKLMCDVLSFVAMTWDDDQAHINLPKHVDQVNRHYEVLRDLCGQEVANHFKELLNRRMAVCRMAE